MDRLRSDFRNPLRRDLDIFLIGSVVALLSILWLDRWIAGALALGSLPGDLRKVISLAEVFALGSTIILFMLVAASLDTRRWRVLPRLATSAFAAGMAANVVKLFIVRTRPSNFDVAERTADSFQGILVHGLNLGASELQSFPSSHTATGFGFAIGLITLYPQGRIIFLVCAGLAAIQRVAAGAHFPSDVMMGAVVGLLVGGWVNRGWLGEKFTTLEGKLPTTSDPHNESTAVQQSDDPSSRQSRQAA